MLREYERLQDERDKILQERRMLYDRMQKIEQLQQLQRTYQEELRRLRSEAEARGEEEEENQLMQEEMQN
jgi:hypothetical protein